jgi:hypothetical protein
MRRKLASEPNTEDCLARCHHCFDRAIFFKLSPGAKVLGQVTLPVLDTGCGSACCALAIRPF